MARLCSPVGTCTRSSLHSVRATAIPRASPHTNACSHDGVLFSQAIMTAVLLCTRSELVAGCRCLLAASHSALVRRKSPGVRAS